MARAESGRAALSAGDASAARRELSAALSLAPKFEGPAELLAELDRAEGNRTAEVEHARAAAGAAPRRADLRYGLANALAFEKRLDEAQREYLEAIRLKPDFAGAEENLGVTYKWQGRLDLAIPHFRRAHRLDPSLSSAACDLAGALATLGRTGDALAILEGYRQRRPDDRVAAELEKDIRSSARASRP